MTIKQALHVASVIALLVLVNACIIYYISASHNSQPNVSQSEPITTITQELQGSLLSGKILWHGNSDIKEVALTFDDGPSSKDTPRFLDILKKHNVKATFFVLGKFAEKNTALISREAAEGHVIGNHTYSHADGKMTDLDKIRKEISRTDLIIEKFTGKNEKYFRTPFGYENWRFLSEAEMSKHKIVLWTLDVADWDHTKKEKEMVAKIMRNTKNGSIILLHDGGGSREAVIKALPKIITGLRKKGFEFVTVDEMIAHL
jgi:peptidoglycan/xylan/chitin deacetylase (PgdA/CDA1 family)